VSDEIQEQVKKGIKMLTNIKIENFKKLENLSFSMSSSVVIIGPNNSGKSTVFQALCLWETGVKRFIAAYQKKDLDKKGNVTVNRQDLLNSPVSDARFLWTDSNVSKRNNAGNGLKYIPITVELSGENNGRTWTCKAEFVFYNTESFSCKIVLGLKEMIDLYDNDNGIHFSFLQAMSGISAFEDKLPQGSIDRRLGEGKTAEVLRNICHQILYPEIKRKKSADAEAKWNKLCDIIESMFGAKLERPQFIKATGLMSLEYVENSVRYDISSGGRGFLQTLLLFAHMFANPDTVMLLDEPDAHLEVIRQREIFHKINEIAVETNTQIIIASHSEVILDEAADTSSVIVLIENRATPLNISTKSQSLKYIKRALTEIGWEKYYLAKLKGHVLYLEGSTDLQMLLCFANKLKHKVEPLLRVANVQYTSDNVPETAIRNFVSLKEIFNGLKGLALFDNIPNLQPNPKLQIICWQKRELENYFASPALLLKYARTLHNQYPQFTPAHLEKAMQQSIFDYTLPACLKNPSDEWWNTAKLSDEWLDKIFPEFYKQTGISAGANFKKDYYQLISLMDTNDVLMEISDKLNIIYELLKVNT
jgi:ABC-type cobalamin/Fe3+-siderophores transport system ATPase subunit